MTFQQVPNFESMLFSSLLRFLYAVAQLKASHDLFALRLLVDLPDDCEMMVPAQKRSQWGVFRKVRPLLLESWYYAA